MLGIVVFYTLALGAAVLRGTVVLGNVVFRA